MSREGRCVILLSPERLILRVREKQKINRKEIVENKESVMNVRDKSDRVIHPISSFFVPFSFDFFTMTDVCYVSKAQALLISHLALVL